jgi:hypothetical protein
VCDADSFCCQDVWDQACVNLGIEACGACEGIAVVPGLAARPSPRAAPPSAAAIRNAMYALLDARKPKAGSPAAQLRDRLADHDDADAHRERVERFLLACQDRATVRDPAALVRDVLEVATRRKNDARAGTGLLDAMAVVTVDALRPGEDAHLDPATCELGD